MRLAHLMLGAILVPVVAGCAASGGSQTSAATPTFSVATTSTPAGQISATVSPVVQATTQASPSVQGTQASPVAQVPTVTQATAAPASSPSAAAPRASPVTQGRTGDSASIDPNPAELVYEHNQASVVSIISLAAAPTRLGSAQQQRGIGSGFVLDQEGHIVTNNHVVEDADQLTVTFPDPKRTVVPARLIGRDPDNDLAVIKVDPREMGGTGLSTGQLLDHVTLGDVDSVKIGQHAIAIGSPLGLQQTVTSGIVSALRPPTDEPSEALELLGGAIQTDAAINPGNSGGPLFNAQGEVIGVNTAILSQSGGNIGVGFAIPINVVKRIVPELISYGCYRHPLVGVTTVPLSLIGQSAKRDLGLPADQAGLLVQEVSAGAQEAGVRAGSQVANLGGAQLRVGGDIILGIDGQDVSSGGDLRAYIENNKRPGDAVTLSVLRGGQPTDVNVRLSEKPSEVCPR